MQFRQVGNENILFCLTESIIKCFPQHWCSWTKHWWSTICQSIQNMMSLLGLYDFFPDLQQVFCILKSYSEEMKAVPGNDLQSKLASTFCHLTPIIMWWVLPRAASQKTTYLQFPRNLWEKEPKSHFFFFEMDTLVFILLKCDMI